jgi:hypothetical protein
MTQIEHLREQAQRAEWLVRNLLNALTVARLPEASEYYRSQIDNLEQSDRCGTRANAGFVDGLTINPDIPNQTTL